MPDYLRQWNEAMLDNENLRSQITELREEKENAWEIIKEAQKKLAKAGYPFLIDDGSTGGCPITLDEQVESIIKDLNSKSVK